jgi:hypothetical protein
MLLNKRIRAQQNASQKPALHSQHLKVAAIRFALITQVLALETQ